MRFGAAREPESWAQAPSAMETRLMTRLQAQCNPTALTRPPLQNAACHKDHGNASENRTFCLRQPFQKSTSIDNEIYKQQQLPVPFLNRDEK